MKLILFDFDGVLAHTHLMCFEIHKELNPDLSYDFFQSLSFGNFPELYSKAEKENKIKNNPNYYKIYSDRLLGLEMSEELKNVIRGISAKYSLFIVSSSSSDWIIPFFKKESIIANFKDILGRDLHFSKIKKIKHLLEKYKTLPKDVLFITDTTGDIKEARDCGVASVGVTWGLHNREHLEKEKPFALVDTPQELKQKIEEFFTEYK